MVLLLEKTYAVDKRECCYKEESRILVYKFIFFRLV